MSYEAMYFTLPLYPAPLLASLLSEWLANALAWVQFPLYVMILGLGSRTRGPLRTLACLLLFHVAAVSAIFACAAVRACLHSLFGWGG
jgi:hypothetical protein